MKEANVKQESGKMNASDDFKVALSTITSETDFELFKNRFLN